MEKDKSKMGRRQFLVAAGVASTTALASAKLAGIANAAETATKGSEATSAKAASSKCVVIYSSMTGNTEKVAKAYEPGHFVSSIRIDYT